MTTSVSQLGYGLVHSVIPVIIGYWVWLPWCHEVETFFPLLALCAGIPLTKASDTKLWCFLWSAPEQTVEQTIEMPVIWDAIMLIMMSL